MEIIESKYPKGTPMESYKKILRVIVSLDSNIDPSVIDTQFNVIDNLIDNFDRMYSDTIEISKVVGFMRISKDLRYKQIVKEIDERH